MYFRLEILKSNGSSIATFVSESLKKAKEKYDQSLLKAQDFQRAQIKT